MIDTTTIVQRLKEQISEEVSLVADGLDRFIVHVPFTFEDGDHYVILLKREGSQWVLTDEGHTYMHLSYTIADFDQGNRRRVIDRVLNGLQVEDRAGQLVMRVTDENAIAGAVFTYAQAVLRVTDVSFLSREVVKTTFYEDFQRVVSETSHEQKRTVDFKYHHPVRDTEKRYPVDARVNGDSSRQVILFAIGNDEQCRDATIIGRQWEHWREPFKLSGIFRDQTEINRLVLARFSDVAERQFSTLETARERLGRFLGDA